MLGAYGQLTGYVATSITLSPFKMEIGLTGSMEGGGGTTLLSAELTPTLMGSLNATKLSDLEGVSVGGGVSVKAGGGIGVDADTSKPDSSGTRIGTGSLSVGVGLNVTPYAAPIETHAGVSQSKVFAKMDVVEATTKASALVNTGVDYVKKTAVKAWSNVKSKWGMIKKSMPKNKNNKSNG